MKAIHKKERKRLLAIDKKEVTEIVDAIGGKENVSKATHCVTRLRFSLDDEEQVNKDKLESIGLVKGSFSANNQFQVVIGQGTVDKVYQEMVNQTGIEDATKSDVKEEASKKDGENTNAFQRGVKTLADIFIPILPAIVTAGLLLGISNLLTTEGIFMEPSIVQAYPAWSGIANMIALIANTAFTFLPALVGWSAAPKFGGSSLLGVVLGLALVNPSLISPSSVATAGEIPTWNIFGLEIQQVGYHGQVLPMLVASYILAKIEVGMKKIVPDSIQMLFVAPTALLVTGVLSFIVIGPITLQLSEWITNAVISIINFSPTLGGLIYGASTGP